MPVFLNNLNKFTIMIVKKTLMHENLQQEILINYKGRLRLIT